MSIPSSTRTPCFLALALLLTACGGDSTDTLLDDSLAGDDTTVDTGDPGGDDSTGELVVVLPGRIAYQVGEDADAGIYVMDTDGGNQTKITNHAGPDYGPAWAPGPCRPNPLNRIYDYVV